MAIKKILIKIFFFVRNLMYGIFGYFETNKIVKGKTDKPKAFLIGTPEHDNLGDHAIALAEYQFLEKFFPGLEIVEITVESWRKYKASLKKNVTRDDIFFMTGGGNMGDIYLEDEKLRRFVISHYPNNKVIVFPQTIYFSKTRKGQKELDKSKRIYNSHKHLLICARERQSYENMKSIFSSEIYLCPDIVFALRVNITPMEQKKIVGVCLRDDCENNISLLERERLISMLSEGNMIAHFNTCLPHGLKGSDREFQIRLLLEKITEYQFTVTNRLHGMIFSLLAGVPCYPIYQGIVKLTSTIDWLEQKELNGHMVMICTRDRLKVFEEYYFNLANKIKIV